MDKSYSPKIRESDLMITKVGDEIVVYDSRTNEASCLNPLTSAVWEACDGNNDLSRILEQVKRAGFSKSNIELIWKAIDHLDQAELLEEQPNSGERDTTKRRELFRRLSLGAVGAIPLVSTVLVQPAMAQISGPCTLTFNQECDPTGAPPCCVPPLICVQVGNRFRCRNP